MKNKFLIVLFTFGALALSACGGDNNASSEQSSSSSSGIITSSETLSSEEMSISSSEAVSSGDVSISSGDYSIDSSSSGIAPSSSEIAPTVNIEEYNSLLVKPYAKLDLIITVKKNDNTLYSHYRVTKQETNYKVEYAFETYNQIVLDNLDDEAIKENKGKYIYEDETIKNQIGTVSPIDFDTLSLLKFRFSNSHYSSLKKYDTKIIGYVKNMNTVLSTTNIEYGVINLHFDTTNIKQLTFAWNDDDIAINYSYVFTY